MVLGVVGTVLCLLWLAGTVALSVYVGDWFGGLLLIAFTLFVVVRMGIPAAWLLADLGSMRQAEKRVKTARQEGHLPRLLVAKARLLVLRWQRRQ